MKGTWGRRVYGTVHRGPTYTRFRLEFTLDNQCTFYETAVLPNRELDRYTRLYGHTLNRMTDKLASRVAQRAQ